MMALSDDGPHRLVYRVRSPLQNGVGVLGLFFLGWLLVHWLTRNSNQDRFIGLIGASATCLLIALLSETSDFVFDRQTQQLTWVRRFGLRRRRGEVAFADINQVVVRTALGSDRVAPSQRVVLLTTTGELPLSCGYAPSDAHAGDAERLRNFMNKTRSDALSDNIAALVQAGRDIDAIPELRLARQLTLEQAKAEIERLRAGQP